MPSKSPYHELTHEQLLTRIAERDDKAWQELVSRDYVRLEQELHPIYTRNPIRGAGRSFADVLQELVVPNPNQPDALGYLQKALIDTKPSTEVDYIRLAKHKFQQRLVDEARREIRQQVPIALEFAEDIPEQPPAGLGTIETWQSVRDAVRELDEVERIVARLFYGLPQTIDGDSAQGELPIEEIKQELQKRGHDLDYEQVKWKLRKARRLLGVLLYPIQEAIESD